MKRLWIGAILLAVLLLMGIVLTVSFERLHRPLAQKVDSAAAAAAAGDWERADVLISQTKAEWEHFRNFTAAVADHEPLEEMDSLFSQLESLLQLREKDEFVAGCRQLARLAEAIADSQSIKWWSLL